MIKYAFSTLILGVAISGCASRSQDSYQVVDQSYIHRYGVEVQPDAWASQGETGQVVTTLKSGVVVTKTYLNGTLEGDTTYTFPHSKQIERTESYSKGYLVQEINFHRNGTQSSRTLHTGPVTLEIFSWYDNGTPKSKEWYENSLLVKGNYYSLDHQIDSQVDKSVGTRTRRDPFGHLEAIDTIQGGEITLSKTFYPSGALRQLVPYVNGKVEGEVKIFLPGGEPTSVETWANNEKTGLTTLFENGERVAEVPYCRGVKEGVERRFRDGVIVVSEISWVDDLQHGPTRTYIGDKTTTDYFVEGKAVSRSVYEKMTSGVLTNALRR